MSKEEENKGKDISENIRSFGKVSEKRNAEENNLCKN